MINVLIPVANCDMLTELLDQIEQNTVLPRSVLIINNSGYSLTLSGYSFKLHQQFFLKNIGVNASWNYGLEFYKGKGHLLILNDDVFIRRNFFKKIEKAFDDPQLGVVCPNTVNEMDHFFTHDAESGVVVMKKREGWAFTIRKELTSKLDPIPKELHTFFGDDWFWCKTHELGYYWKKDLSNVIYHRVGSSMRIYPENRARLKTELEIFKKLMDR